MCRYVIITADEKHVQLELPERPADRKRGSKWEQSGIDRVFPMEGTEMIVSTVVYWNTLQFQFGMPKFRYNIKPINSTAKKVSLLLLNLRLFFVSICKDKIIQRVGMENNQDLIPDCVTAYNFKGSNFVRLYIHYLQGL